MHSGVSMSVDINLENRIGKRWNGMSQRMTPGMLYNKYIEIPRHKHSEHSTPFQQGFNPSVPRWQW